MTDISISQRIQTVLQRPLTTLEVMIIVGSWEGQRYGSMAQKSGYGEEYIKQVGAKLWAELSDQMGTLITKKNLRLAFHDPQEEPGKAGRLGQPQPAVSPVQAVVPAPGVPSPQPLPGPFDYPSGPLPLDSPLYINRSPIEETAFAEVTRPGCLLCIKAPRRFGKTSFLYRVIAYATDQGYRSCRLDLQEADHPAFSSIDAFLRWFCYRMAHALDLDLKVEALWDQDLGSKVNAGICLQTLLAQADTPLLLTINALEQVFAQASVAHDFLSMLRFWHERSKEDGLWQRLHLVLVYGTDSYVALNLESSAFNVGHSLWLPPFTLEQFLALGRRYQLPLIDQPSQRSDLEALYRLIAGHPYLANLSFYALTQARQPLSVVLNTSTTLDSIFRAHLQELWAQLRQNPAALATWQRVLAAPGVALNMIDTMQLESLGLLRVEDGLAYPICELYQVFFTAFSAMPMPWG